LQIKHLKWALDQKERVRIVGNDNPDELLLVAGFSTKINYKVAFKKNKMQAEKSKFGLIFVSVYS
jgi:hypothetical protein